MPQPNDPRIITREKFQAILVQKQMYEGLVEDLGYVHWEARRIYLKRINPNEGFWVIPKYIPVQNMFEAGGPMDTSTIVHDMYVMTPGELKWEHPDLYAVYEINRRIRHGITEQPDALRVHHYPLPDINTSENQSSGLDVRQGRMERHNEIANTAIDILSDIGMIELPTVVERGRAILTLIDAALNPDEGKNWAISALEASISLIPYSWLFEAFSAYGNSPHYHREDAVYNASRYKYYESLYWLERDWGGGRRTFIRQNNYLEEMSKAKDKFEQNMRELNISY